MAIKKSILIFSLFLMSVFLIAQEGYPSEDVIKRFHKLDKQEKEQIFTQLFIIENATVENGMFKLLIPEISLTQTDEGITIDFLNDMIVVIGDDKYGIIYKMDIGNLETDGEFRNKKKELKVGLITGTNALILGVIIGVLVAK